MHTVAQLALLLIGLLILALSLLFAIPSFIRGEIRAGMVGLLGALPGGGLLALGILGGPWSLPLAIGLVGLGTVGSIILALPVGRVDHVNQRPSAQVDERTIIFARWRLKPGTPEYEEYYWQHPEHHTADAIIPTLPGLLSPRAPLAEPRAFAAAEAGFFLAEALRDAVEGPAAPTRQELSPQSASRYLKHLARYFGARNCGIAEVQPYQVYSHIGRGSGVYGAPVVLDHPYVLVFSFEMAAEMVRSAPRAPETMETARQYSEAAQTAVQVAAWIRAMGYEALAHIDGNYRLILPLAGRDAGLGEIGRMGLLMTPELGPRVRLSAVTTTLPLMPDPPGDSPAVLDFCRMCKKCAENCPARAIPTGDRQEIDGALRWKIDAEACFRYWNTVGTDCGRCMQVCPYSHAADPAHNLMRWFVAHSGSARRVALWLDDWIYRRKPPVQPGPKWVNES